MEFSAFEITGPPMVGPSSSHTAGACRIGWSARALLASRPASATVFLHGSFAATGDGHGTKEAFAAGLLGMNPEDERLKDALQIAKADGLTLEFQEIDLGLSAHSNSCQIEVQSGSGDSLSLLAASVGGGSIILTEIDGFPSGLRGTLETIVLWHQDVRGFLAQTTAALVSAEINIATIRTSRKNRGEPAVTAIEVEGILPAETASLLAGVDGLARLAVLPILPGY